MQLRDYQQQCLDDIDAAFDAGNRSVLAVMPTGSGKTVSFSAWAAKQRLPVLAQVHRVELVSQISVTFAGFGIKHRIIAPAATIRSIRAEHFERFGKTFDHPSAPVAVASVDTFVARLEKYKTYASTVGAVITDEAAHVLRENKWGRAMELFPHARLLGFTATPCRADGKGLGVQADGVFETMVLGPSVGELIALGHLSDYRIIAKPSDMDLSNVRTTAGGDYSGKQLRLKSHESHIVGDVVMEYKKHALGKQGITFTVDVETANELAAQFREAGVPAASVSAKTPEAERQATIKAFRRGELQQLTNCDLFGEGFDVPNVEVVSLARPTQSLSLHLQQVGRALRPAEGKEHALIIDHVGNWERHGLPDTPRSWTLAGRVKGTRRIQDPYKSSLTNCSNCFKVFERVQLPICPHCGFEHSPDARRSPEQVDGDLEMLDPDALAELREKVELPSPGDVASKVTHKAGRLAGKAAFNQAEERIRSQVKLREAINDWGDRCREEGLTDRQGWRKFFLTFGVDVLTAQTLSRKAMDELRERIEGNA